jgi:hypothetical protein
VHRASWPRITTRIGPITADLEFLAAWRIGEVPAEMLAATAEALLSARPAPDTLPA